MKGILVWMGIFLLTAVPLSRAGQSDSLPLAAGICVNKANRFIRDKKPEEAVKVLQAFREDKKGEAHYYIDFLLGNCFMMMEKGGPGSLAQAEAAYERALDKAPDLSSAWLNLAQCRYGLGKMGPAASAFVKGYETGKEKDPKTLYYGAACWYFAKEYPAALETFHRLLAGHKARLEWTEILVNTLFAMDRHREALPWLKELADKSSGKKQRQWQEVLLYQYLTLEMDETVLEYARCLTRTDPGEPGWWKALSHIHLGKNRLEKGLQSLMIYGFLTPLSPSETRLMADLYSACNIPLEAARCYENEVGQLTGAAGPEMTGTIFKIAAAYMRGGDPKTALSWADKGLALAPHAGLLRLKADLFFNEKNYGDALDLYDQLARFSSEEGRARLMAGYAAWNLGRLDRAARDFGLAVRHPKQKRAAAGALAQIKKIRTEQQVSGPGKKP